MAQKQSQQVTLLDNVAKPVPGGFQIWFVVQDADLNLHAHLEQAQHLIESHAREILLDEPMQAGHFGLAAKLLERIRVAIDVAESGARPSLPDSAGKVSASKAVKVKHEYGDNGICQVKHDGKHTCGAIRQRKARKGSSADAAVLAAERTGNLLATAGKNGVPEMQVIVDGEPVTKPEKPTRVTIEGADAP